MQNKTSPEHEQLAEGAVDDISKAELSRRKFLSGTGSSGSHYTAGTLILHNISPELRACCQRGSGLAQYPQSWAGGANGARNPFQLRAGRKGLGAEAARRARGEGVEAWYDAQLGAGENWRLPSREAIRFSCVG